MRYKSDNVATSRRVRPKISPKWGSLPYKIAALREAHQFARQAQDAGSTPAAAAVSAARRRLRPILMTSLAFILGVAPLVVATGAGAEMRQSLGTAVFAGMLGVTGFGLIFTPAFYTLMQRIGIARGRASAPAPRDQSHERKGTAVAAARPQVGH